MAHFNIETSVLVDYAFVVGGKAEFTVVRPKTGIEYTFRVLESKNPALLFVYMLVGADNHNDFIYVGSYYKNENKLKPTAASKFKSDNLVFTVFNWVIDRLFKASKIGRPKDMIFTEDQDVRVYHVGKCAKCGHKLTDAESIETGWGPVCAGRTPQKKNKKGVKKPNARKKEAVLQSV